MAVEINEVIVIDNDKNVNVGVITATSYSGQNINLTGVVTAIGANFSGNVSVGGTLTYEDVTNIDSVGLITARSGINVLAGGIDVNGISTFTNVNVGVVTASNLISDEIKVITLSEKLTRVDGNIVNLVYNSNSSNIGFCTNPSTDITLNVTGIPTTNDFDNFVLTFNVVVDPTGTARTCTAVTLNGVSRPINWAGGSLSSAITGVTTSNGTDMFTFTGINTVGSASTTDNYRILGMVNGGFR